MTVRSGTGGGPVSLAVPRIRIRMPSRRLVMAAIPVAVFAAIAIAGPLLVPYDHVHTDLLARLKPPLTQVSSGIAWFGTDQTGRDLFGQVVHGARVSLIVGFSTVFIAGVIGALTGILAGFRGGWLDELLMRVADIQLALPAFLLAILIAAVIGPSVVNVVITLALTRWVVFARVARGSTVAVREREFVDSARLLGASRWRLMRRHILPLAITPLLIVATTQFGLVILAEASLSFLGLGVPTGVPSWGQTIASGRDYIGSAWWIATMAGLVLALVTISFGVFGDTLRDELDPRMKGR
jgi:peptide/nickel transport system permease protein